MFRNRTRILSKQPAIDSVKEMGYKISAGELTLYFADGHLESFTTSKVRALKPLYVDVDQAQSVVKYSFKDGTILEKTRALVVVQD